MVICSFEGIDFIIDKSIFLRNMQIFKKKSTMYRGKYILQNLISSVSLRLKKERTKIWKNSI